MKVKLEKLLLKKDLETLYNMMTDSDQYLYSQIVNLNSLEEFRDWLIHKLSYEFHDFYLLISERDKAIIGFAHNYDFNLIGGHCKLSIYIKPEFRNTGLGGFASISFINRLFKEYPLKKVYSIIFGYNSQSLTSNLKAGFETEGVLRKSKYYNRKYYDVYYLSLNRENFIKNLKRFV